VRVHAATIAGYQTVLFPDHIESLAPMHTGFTTPSGSTYAQFTMDGLADRVGHVHRAAGDGLRRPSPGFDAMAGRLAGVG
jgi:hypothetical protein